jgi:hypothetical protein
LNQRGKWAANRHATALRVTLKSPAQPDDFGRLGQTQPNSGGGYGKIIEH